MTISLVEVKICSTLIFNVKRKIHMIIVLQSATIQFRRIFDIFCITKCGKVILLQSVIDCCYKGSQVLQSVTNCYYKVRQVLQSVTDLITKCAGY